jgi:hypothetical protein
VRPAFHRVAESPAFGFHVLNTSYSLRSKASRLARGSATEYHVALTCEKALALVGTVAADEQIAVAGAVDYASTDCGA